MAHTEDDFVSGKAEMLQQAIFDAICPAVDSQFASKLVPQIATMLEEHFYPVEPRGNGYVSPRIAEIKAAHEKDAALYAKCRCDGGRGCCPRCYE